MSDFAIAKSFALANGKLSMTDRGRVFDFVLKLQADPSQPGLRLERIETSAGEGMWSGRVSRDLRAIVQRDGDIFTLLFAGHHDDAYRWAARNRTERHAVTGALQIVESPPVQETQRAPPAPATPRSFDAWPDSALLALGLPSDWLPSVRQVTSEEGFFEVMDHLPEEAAENLFHLLAGETVEPAPQTPLNRPALENPDTRRRFFLPERDDELQRMLEQPLATWIAFLHPSQQRLATGRFNGPVKVTGSAGTGKTVVAMHRARHLARQGKRVLLTSFVNTLCDNLEHTLRKLCSPDELARITVSTVHSQAGSLVSAARERHQAIGQPQLERIIDRARQQAACPFATGFLMAEWDSVLHVQDVSTWEEYRGASRAGRGRGLTAGERQRVWRVFELVLNDLAAHKQTDWPGLCRRARTLLALGRITSPFDAVVVDEVQDLGPQEVRLLRALGGSGPDGLMLVGDGGQRLYQRGFSLRSAGIDVRGRSHVLRINYRTTEQIRRYADRINSDTSDDLDGGEEERKRCQSLLRGPEPVARGFTTVAEQYRVVAAEVQSWIQQGLSPDEIAVFAPSNSRVDAIKRSLDLAGIPARRLAQPEPDGRPAVSVGTMHRAKGLEFKAVAVIDASDDCIPSSAALHEADGEQDRDSALARQRNLLYVSLTRARDEVFLTWAGRPSRFLNGVPAAG